MDFSTLITPVLTVVAVAAWDLVRTFWFARYTAKLTAKQMNQAAILHCRQRNQISDLQGEVRLLTNKTHRNHIAMDNME